MTSLLPQHHPDQNLLIEFATGSIDYAHAIAVSAHIHYCARCRNEVQRLEHIGGSLLASSQIVETTDRPAVSNDETFNKLMVSIDEKSAADQKPAFTTENITLEKTIRDTSDKLEQLPTSVHKMLTDKPVKWRRITKNLKSANLISGQTQYGVSLQKIKAGGHVPEHDHRGCEMTVVLKGSFSDSDNIYNEGDFLLKQVGEKHQPVASSNQDCLCLSVEAAPVKLTSIWGKLINPFLKIHAA